MCGLMGQTVSMFRFDRFQAMYGGRTEPKRYEWIESGANSAPQRQLATNAANELHNTYSSGTQYGSTAAVITTCLPPRPIPVDVMAFLEFSFELFADFCNF
jgi:hypothetical protein